MSQNNYAEGTSIESAAEHVADKIRDAIFDGAYQPGDPLREIGITESLAVSRRTVREALLILAAQGLVVHEHNRGASVCRLSSDDVRDLYQVRRTLEAEGARHCVGANPVDLARLDAAYSALAEGIYNENSKEITRLDLEFHGAVIGLAGSRRLNAYYHQSSYEMRMAIAILRQGEVDEELTPVELLDEHRLIYDFLRHGDAFEAQRAILGHIETNERRLLRLI
jgi:DNA-binding GntR family transcriptional regulator